MLKPKVRRTELKVWIRIFAPALALRDWRTLNRWMAELAELHPKWTPEQAFAYIVANRPAAVERAERIARPHGTAKDVLGEQTYYWFLERDLLLPKDKDLKRWLRWGWLCGRETDPLGEVDLEPKEIQAVGGRIKHGYSFEEIGSLTNTSRTSAHRYWGCFLSAVEHGKCHCGSSHCSLNKAKYRKWLVTRLDAKSKGLIDPAFHAASGKWGRGGAGGVAAMYDGVHRANPAYRVEKVNGMEIHAHRLAWIRHYGRIPSEHQIHHVDGDPANNGIRNLRLLPTWLHKACHLVAKTVS